MEGADSVFEFESMGNERSDVNQSTCNKSDGFGILERISGTQKQEGRSEILG
jgi:hypothetical protein